MMTTELDEAQRFATNNGQYTIIKSIGKGSFGTVYLAQNKNRQKVAIKILRASASFTDILLWKNPQRVNEGLQEAQRLFTLRHHENILEFLDMYKFTPKFFTYGIAIVTKYYAKGSLQENLQKFSQPPNIMHRLIWYKQLAAGLAFIHKNDFAHRDIKPANILVDSNDNLKIGDVGLAKAIWDLQSGNQEMTFDEYMSSCVGTTPYMAPEVLSAHYSIKCDVFSIGLVYAMIMECPDPLVPQVQLENKADGFTSLGWLLYCIEASRSRRAIELLYPPFCNAQDDEKKLLNEMLCYNPQSRPSMIEVEGKISNLIAKYKPLNPHLKWVHQNQDKSERSNISLIFLLFLFLLFLLVCIAAFPLIIAFIKIVFNLLVFYVLPFFISIISLIFALFFIFRS